MAPHLAGVVTAGDEVGVFVFDGVAETGTLVTSGEVATGHDVGGSTVGLVETGDEVGGSAVGLVETGDDVGGSTAGLVETGDEVGGSTEGLVETGGCGAEVVG